MLKKLFDTFIEFITLPIVISIIGILSFIFTVIAFIVDWQAYRLKEKSDEYLEYIESSIDKIKNSVKKILTIFLQIKKKVTLIKYLFKQRDLQSFTNIQKQKDLKKKSTKPI